MMIKAILSAPSEVKFKQTKLVVNYVSCISVL